MQIHWSFCFLLLFCLSAVLVRAQTCDGVLMQNILSGGSFGSGTETFVPNDPFLTSAYTYKSSPPLTEGFYTLANTTNVGDTGACWLTGGDNSTDPNGYMMIVNADDDPGILFERTVEVCDGINYEFSMDVLNLLRADCANGIAPNIELLVDGVVISQTGAIPQDENWHTFRSLITISEGTDLITISLRNNATGGVGNDLGLDNLSLRHCAPAINLPAITLACEEGTILSVVTDEIAYASPYFQWQRSFDGGNSWSDITGADNSSYFIADPIDGLQYRLLVANGPVNFLNPSCRAISTATTTEIQTPLNVYQTPVICEGDTLHIQGESFTQAGNYTVPVGGLSGCDSILNIQLFTNPAYDQLYSQQLCEGEAFLGQLFEQDTLLRFSYQTTAGCDSIIRYEIDVSTAPDNLEITGESIICQGAETQWEGPAGYTNYEWSNGETTQLISISAAQTYQLEVQNSQGCVYTIEQELTISDPVFEAITEDISCAGATDGQVAISFPDGGLAPYQYELVGIGSQSDPVFSNLVPGLYDVVLTDAIGCSFEQTVSIGGAQGIVAELGGIPSQAIEAGDTLQLSVSSPTGGLTYNWYGDGLPSCKDCNETNWVVFPGGTISVELVNEKGCAIVLDTLIQVLDPYRIYQPTAFSPNGDGENDVFSFGLGSNVASIERLEVFDRWGALVYQRNTTTPTIADGWDGTREGEAMPVGVYLYQAEIKFQNGRLKQFAGDVLLIR